MLLRADDVTESRVSSVDGDPSPGRVAVQAITGSDPSPAGVTCRSNGCQNGQRYLSPELRSSQDTSTAITPADDMWLVERFPLYCSHNELCVTHSGSVHFIE